MAYNQLWLIYGQRTKSCQHLDVRHTISAAYNNEITVNEYNTTVFADKFLFLICSYKRNNWIHNSNHKKVQKGLDYHKPPALLAAVMETSLSTLEAAVFSPLQQEMLVLSTDRSAHPQRTMRR